MTIGRQNRRKSALLAAIVAAGAVSCAQAEATIHRDCFEVIPYGDYCRHVACRVDGLTDIHYAVDRFKTNDWEVTCHGGGTESRIVRAQPGEHILSDNVFTNRSWTVTGSAYPFVFEFYNWYKNGTSGKTWYGYVSLGLDENAELVILDSAITDCQGVLTVIGTPVALLPSSLKTIDHGDWLELDRQCIPTDTTGAIAIPSEIDGKPVLAIGDFAFDSCKRVTEIMIPDGILSIGDRAFSGCRSLSRLVIPQSVTNVGRTALQSCDALGELRINAPLSAMGCEAFAHCGVTNVVLTVGITNIYNHAFADCGKLVGVTIPQSVQRICTRSFDENCKSLKAVSVPYATVVEDEAFPSGCAITRYGPYLSVAGDLAEPDIETKIAMCRTLDWQDYASRLEVAFLEMKPPYANEPDSRAAVYACAHLGIAPAVVDDEGCDNHILAYYKMPSVEFLRIDPATRTITGRVVPAEGTRIVSPPLRRAFGFHRIYEDDGRWSEGMDWGELLCYDTSGYSLNASDYVSSNGIFRITYGEHVLREKCPQPTHLFKIRLRDRKEGLW